MARHSPHNTSHQTPSIYLLPPSKHPLISGGSRSFFQGGGIFFKGGPEGPSQRGSFLTTKKGKKLFSSRIGSLAFPFLPWRFERCTLPSNLLIL